MLANCLHGKTQNANESFNGMIWNRIPKPNHVGLNILSLGVYDAISHFNNGRKATLDLMEEMNIPPCDFLMRACQSINVETKTMSAYKMSAFKMPGRGESTLSHVSRRQINYEYFQHNYQYRIRKV